MKLIKVREKKYSKLRIKVSDCDFKYLNQFKWYAAKKRKYIYAYRFPCSNGKKVSIPMGREILKPSPNMLVDHKNHDTLDNQRENIRICTPSENMMNKKTPKHNTTGFKGVSYVMESRKWLAEINAHKKRIFLGIFSCPLMAMIARKKAERKYHGEFAYKRYGKETC